MSKTWFTSDLHLGHRFVAGLRGYDDVANHDTAIANNWRKRVQPADTVYVLGDLAMSDPEYALSVVAGLPGVKHFIAGNHDACHPMHRKWRTQLARFLEVFETVQPFGSIRWNGEQILLSHFPYVDDHTSPPRYMQWRLPDMGAWLLHGHTHNASQRLHGREIHVGADAWGLGPVELAVLTGLMS